MLHEDTNNDVSMRGLSSLCSNTSKVSSPTRYSQKSKNNTQDVIATIFQSIINAVVTKEDKSSSDTVKQKQFKQIDKE